MSASTPPPSIHGPSNNQKFATSPTAGITPRKISDCQSPMPYKSSEEWNNSSPSHHVERATYMEPSTPVSLADEIEIKEALFFQEHSMEDEVHVSQSPPEATSSWADLDMALYDESQNDQTALPDIFDETSSVSDSGSDDSYVPDQSDGHAGNQPRNGGLNKSRKRKRASKTTGPRHRTAREYHRYTNAKIPARNRRGFEWKTNELTKMHEDVKKYIQRQNRKKNSRRQVQGFLDPKLLLTNNGGSASESHAGTHHGILPDIGPSTKEDFIEKFIAQFPHLDLHKCKTHYNSLERKSRTFGYGRISKRGKGWHLKGMSPDTTLLNHQLIAAAWMITRECAVEGPFGGIVADDMGLGKTVQTIATIIGNPAGPEDDVQTTLIILQPSLKDQWFGEISLHAPDLAPYVHIYQRDAIDNTVPKLLTQKVVLATFSHIYQSVPQPDPNTIKRWKKQKKNIARATEEWIDDHMSEAGPLHQISWYRIVIDEAQNIRNPDTRLCRAVLRLKGDHRWALTGTPVMNQYQDLFPLFCFIEDPLISQLTPLQFQTDFCNPNDKECVLALGIAISDLFIRRSKTDQIMGEPIIDLPPWVKEVREEKRYKPERILYQAFRKCLKELLHKNLLEGDELKDLASLGSQLTRMRQIIASPDIIARQIMIVFDVDGLEELKKELQTVKLTRRSKSIARILIDRLDQWIEAKKANTHRVKVVEEEAVCTICHQPFEDMMIVRKCNHTFCDYCLSTHKRAKQVEKRGVLVEMFACPRCGKHYNGEDVKSYNKTAALAKGGTKKSMRKGKDLRDFRPALCADQVWPQKWLQDYDEDKGVEMLPTAKLRGVVNQVRAWLNEAPTDKIIVFTQFRLFAILVGIMLQKKGIGFVYFTGDMNPKERATAIRAMQKSPKAQVMIAGLKVGGTGLNFQFANRGIISDIWWNAAIDDQALGRYLRMGQLKEKVYFLRVVVTKTVDSKIIRLQEDKRWATLRITQDEPTQEVLEEILRWHEDDVDNSEDTSDEEDEEEFYESDFDSDDDGF